MKISINLTFQHRKQLVQSGFSSQKLWLHIQRMKFPTFYLFHRNLQVFHQAQVDVSLGDHWQVWVAGDRERHLLTWNTKSLKPSLDV